MMAAKATRGSISSGIFVIITLISASLLCIVAKDLEFHHYHFRKKSNWVCIFLKKFVEVLIVN